MRSRIYLGEVMHARLAPVVHTFRYPAFVFALDIDELPLLDRRLRLFAHNRRGLFSLHDGDYLGDGDGDLRARLRDHLQVAGADIALDRVELITTPRVAGHAFNPVSFFYCYDKDDVLAGVVVEVNNTFGEGHVYALPAAAATRAADNRLRFAARKRFHVSPFNDMDGDYEFSFSRPAESLDVRIDLRRPEGKPFVSRLSGKARALDGRAMLHLATAWPFTVALTLPRILWQAYKLHYRRGLPVFAKPDPSSPSTFAATRPAYISEFSVPGRVGGRRNDNETSESHGSH